MRFYNLPQYVSVTASTERLRRQPLVHGHRGLVRVPLPRLRDHADHVPASCIHRHARPGGPPRSLRRRTLRHVLDRRLHDRTIHPGRGLPGHRRRGPGQGRPGRGRSDRHGVVRDTIIGFPSARARPRAAGTARRKVAAAAIRIVPRAKVAGSDRRAPATAVSDARPRLVFNALPLGGSPDGVSTYIRGLLGALVPEVDASLVAAVQPAGAGGTPAGRDRPGQGALERRPTRLRRCRRLRPCRTGARPRRRPAPRRPAAHRLDRPRPGGVRRALGLPEAEGGRRAHVGAPRLAPGRRDRRSVRVHRRAGPRASPAGKQPSSTLRRAPLSLHRRKPRSDRVRAGYRLPERFVLHVGNIEPRKDVGTLAEACRTAAVPLGGDRSRALGQPRRPRVCSAIGPVPAADLPGLYGAAAVVGYASRYEGFGLPADRGDGLRRSGREHAGAGRDRGGRGRGGHLPTRRRRRALRNARADLLADARASQSSLRDGPRAGAPAQLVEDRRGHRGALPLARRPRLMEPGVPGRPGADAASAGPARADNTGVRSAVGRGRPPSETLAFVAASHRFAPARLRSRCPIWRRSSYRGSSSPTSTTRTWSSPRTTWVPTQPGAPGAPPLLTRPGKSALIALVSAALAVPLTLAAHPSVGRLGPT